MVPGTPRATPPLPQHHLLAHCSDLHVGRPGADEAARALCAQLLREGVDHLLVTGDLVHSGRVDEFERFMEIFAAFGGRMTVVPGNHDRIGRGVAHLLMGGDAVRVDTPPGLYVVRVDTSGPHNRNPRVAHGELPASTLRQLDRALDAAPQGLLVVVAFHHHLIPTPEDSVAERWVHRLGLVTEHEVPGGYRLLELARGRADLLLHGHRHRPAASVLASGAARPLGVYNAGSSTELCRARLFRHCGGKLLSEPGWSQTARPRPTPGPRWMHSVRAVTTMFL
jgi:Icc protein